MDSFIISRNQNFHATTVIKHSSARCTWYFTQGVTQEKSHTNVVCVPAAFLNKQCEVCKKELKTKLHVKKHKDLVHSDSRKFQCRKCSKKFKLSSHLAIHKAVHQTKDQLLVCQTCLKTFSLKISLVSYIKEFHRNVKNYKCNDCKIRFSCKRILEEAQDNAIQRSRSEPFLLHFVQTFFCKITQIQQTSNDSHRQKTLL